MPDIGRGFSHLLSQIRESIWPTVEEETSQHYRKSFELTTRRFFQLLSNWMLYCPGHAIEIRLAAYSSKSMPLFMSPWSRVDSVAYQVDPLRNRVLYWGLRSTIDLLDPEATKVIRAVQFVVEASGDHAAEGKGAVVVVGCRNVRAATLARVLAGLPNVQVDRAGPSSSRAVSRGTKDNDLVYWVPLALHFGID